MPMILAKPRPETPSKYLTGKTGHVKVLGTKTAAMWNRLKPSLVGPEVYTMTAVIDENKTTSYGAQTCVNSATEGDFGFREDGTPHAWVRDENGGFPLLKCGTVVRFTYMLMWSVKNGVSVKRMCWVNVLAINP